MPPPVPSIDRQSLPEQVAKRLHGLIADGTYPAGAQLPHQRQIAELFGVSTAVVRESLALLASSGVIWSRPGQGTFVADAHPALLRYPSWTDRPTSEAELAEATEARDALERAITRLAAQRRTDADVERLRECVAAMEEHQGDGERFASADLAFHLALAETARNRPLLSALASLRQLIHTDIVARATRQIGDGRIERALADHHAVVDAVRDGDVAAAEGLIGGIMERALRAHPTLETPSRPSSEQEPTT